MISSARLRFAGSPASKQYTSTLVSTKLLPLMQIVSRPRPPRSSAAAVRRAGDCCETLSRGGPRLIPCERLEVLAQQRVDRRIALESAQPGTLQQLVVDRDGKVRHVLHGSCVAQSMPSWRRRATRVPTLRLRTLLTLDSIQHLPKVTGVTFGRQRTTMSRAATSPW